VRACLDDLIIALYVTIDDLLGPRLGPGRRPKLSDAEPVCRAVSQVLLGARSERHWCALPVPAWGTCSPSCIIEDDLNSRTGQCAERFAPYWRWFAGNLLATGLWKGLGSPFVVVGATGFEPVACRVTRRPPL
jgi:hypothetical protein